MHHKMQRDNYYATIKLGIGGVNVNFCNKIFYPNILFLTV